jgi:hypothetical protein
VYLTWANSVFLAFFPFNRINNLRIFNIAFSSIPTAPTNLIPFILNAFRTLLFCPYQDRIRTANVHRPRALLRLRPPDENRRVRRLPPRHSFRIAQDRARNEATALPEKMRDRSDHTP